MISVGCCANVLHSANNRARLQSCRATPCSKGRPGPWRSLLVSGHSLQMDGKWTLLRANAEFQIVP